MKFSIEYGEHGVLTFHKEWNYMLDSILHVILAYKKEVEGETKEHQFGLLQDLDEYNKEFYQLINEADFSKLIYAFLDKYPSFGNFLIGSEFDLEGDEREAVGDLRGLSKIYSEIIEWSKDEEESKGWCNTTVFRFEFKEKISLKVFLLETYRAIIYYSNGDFNLLYQLFLELTDFDNPTTKQLRAESGFQRIMLFKSQGNTKHWQEVIGIVKERAIRHCAEEADGTISEDLSQFYEIVSYQRGRSKSIHAKSIKLAEEAIGRKFTAEEKSGRSLQQKSPGL